MSSIKGVGRACAEKWEGLSRDVHLVGSESHSAVSDSFWPHGLCSPWNSPGQNTGMGSLSLLQGIFPTQELNPGLLNCRWILHQLSHKGSPVSSSRDRNKSHTEEVWVGT